MSNSFNISVIPEIAALETKVDTVDTVVDAIRATDVPDIQTNIDANETKIDAIPTDPLFALIPSDDSIVASDPNDTTTSLTYVKIKEFLIRLDGLYRIILSAKTGNPAASFFVRIYKNDVAYGTEHTDNTQQEYIEDLYFAAGDKLQIMIYTTNATYWAGCLQASVSGTTSIIFATKLVGS